MSNDYDDDECYDEGSFKPIPADFIWIGIGFFASCLEAGAEALRDTQQMLSGIINQARDREFFEREAVREIEAITRPPEEAP